MLLVMYKQISTSFSEKNNLFSPWYFWKIGHIAFNNNHSRLSCVNGREQILYTYTVLIILVVVENSQFCVKKIVGFYLFSRQ